ncbi:glycosyltransferase family 2 protein, partial [bacterium]|nr:glycosyltransferase family 2 protein [bacterium]
MSKPRFTISAVILAHQYSPLFEEVVQSVSWCDEIVIVLSEPVKEIEELCHRVSAKCFFRPFDGYGPQKQFAISKASHDWILNIDSDEWVSPKCKKEILELLESDRPSLFSAFTIRQKFMFLGKALNFSGTRKSPIRFFDRKRSQMNSSVVHESIEASGKIGHIQGPILHYSYSSLEDYLNKFNRYTSLAAAELHKKG